ncbi:hypothetical protein F5Y03DRAFT_371257 [Xylaria venustula]|nr:hypothetical protein F5Y03DRAFT_371257 [Xylaria venustula]
MSDQSDQSDQSDHEDDMSLNAAESPSEQYRGEAETDGSDEEDEFFDLEAEESASSDEDDEDEYYSDDPDGGYVSFHDSFPQFARLPAELRIMIWEAVDPDLKCEGRVLDFYLVPGPVDIWESATLARQTAPARKLLATTKESRYLALKHYPDVIEIREGLGKVRFDGSRDVILFQRARLLPELLTSGLGQWYCQIKNLALDFSPYPPPYDELSDSRDKLLQVCGSLKAVFFCCEARELGPDTLGWSVAESSKKFYLERSRSKECDVLYCWPDTESSDTDSHVGFFPPNAMGDTILTLPLVQYTFDQDLRLYNKVKHRYERDIGQKAGSASPLESSEGESFYESELDDYALDGFVVDGSSDGNEEHSDNEDLSDNDGNEDDAQSDQDPDIFNGFSPLEELSDDEVTGNSLKANIIDPGHESAEHHLSDEQSPEEQPRPITQTGRRKRHIVSSDDEDDGEEGGEGSAIQTTLRAKKRARVILSDSEEDEDRSPNDAGSDRQGATRLQQGAIIVDSDSEDGQEEGVKDNERSRPADFKPDEDEDEDEEDSDEDVTEDEDDDEESDEEPTVSKPTSLLARLRQFRSDVPISPEGGSPNSNLDEASDEEEQYEDNGERRVSDAEFPDSAAEEDEEDGW